MGDDLRSRIDAAKADHKRDMGGQTAESKGSAKGAALGFRLATELVAAVGVGGALGWILDKALNTTPWLFLFWLMIGVAAGMTNLVRAARNAQKDNQDASLTGAHNSEGED